MPGKGTAGPIFNMCQGLEKFRESRENLDLLFMDLCMEGIWNSGMFAAAESPERGEHFLRMTMG